MASTNQGDDAVSRLDAAVTAFEEVLTGQEGQTVTVPGHDPQPTLAERVKQNLKPSTDAAAGFASQALAGANAADESAKLAAQIAGLGTVEDAIALAGMPLPDVWSPLVDNLRLITGKGRDVLVGTDVVARYWQFERLSAATERQKDGKLRLVAAGEPRYEGGALVKERGSTNLYFPHDANSGCSATRGAVEVTAGSGLLGEALTTKFREDDQLGGHYMNLKAVSGFTLGEDVSISVEIIPLKTGANSVRLGSNDMALSGISIPITAADIGKPMVITHRSTMTATSLRAFIWLYVDGGSAWQGASEINFEVLSVQVEKGPPTSLIPTNTAAATRATERLWLPGPQNDPGFGKSRTYAIEFELISAATTGYAPIICSGVFPTRHFVDCWNNGTLRASNDNISAVPVSAPVLLKRNTLAVTFNYDGGYISYCLNGGPTVNSSTPCVVAPGQAEAVFERLEIGARGAWSHECSIRLRNFRQWNRPVSDMQLRGIK